MRELALNILDIAENSVKAGASLVCIDVSAKDNLLTISVSDDGCGMDKEFLQRVTDPFTTTRTTRKVGMGIPLFKMAAEMTGGEFEIRSQKGVGTVTKASFVIDSVDRAPLGDLGETMATLLNDEIPTEFLLTVSVGDNQFVFDTRELKAELDGISVCEPQVVLFVKDMIKENIKGIGGANL